LLVKEIKNEVKLCGEKRCQGSPEEMTSAVARFKVAVGNTVGGEVTPWLPEKWDNETDIVVAGAGMSGLSAAIEARDAKADVLVLEKMPTITGASWISGGVIYAAGTSVQRKAGIIDSPSEMYKHWIAVGEGLADREHVRLIADKSAEAVEWLIKLGAEFPPEDLYISGPEDEPEYAVVTPPKPRGHHQKGAGYTGHLWIPLFKKIVKERGIEIMLRAPVKDLIANPVTKEVLGVEVKSRGKTIYIRTRKAVVLACGSVMRNMEMVRGFLPIVPVDVGRSTSPPSSTGNGIKLAQQLGADVINMAGSFIGLEHDTAVPVRPPNPISRKQPYPSILINKYGRRFVDETRHGKATRAAYCQEGHVVYQIFDEEVRKKVCARAHSARLIRADNIRELATKIEVDAETLKYTLNRWNKYAEKGEDPEFGRKIAVSPMRTPPFCAFKVKWRLGSSQSGGVRTNTKAQVINVAGKVIPRLYAVGRTASGPFGKYYPGSGSFITHCIVSGHTAGKNAARETPW